MQGRGFKIALRQYPKEKISPKVRILVRPLELVSLAGAKGQPGAPGETLLTTNVAFVLCNSITLQPQKTTDKLVPANVQKN